MNSKHFLYEIFLILNFFLLLITSCVTHSKKEYLPSEISTVEQNVEPVTQEETVIQEPEIVQPETVVIPEVKPIYPSLSLTFAGDIMAHEQNFNTSDYSLIYKDIEEILKNDDLSFANFETPIDKDKPYENYPTFNVQPPYADAAINAGFDVFSLANNHSGDQGKKGIEQTYKYFSEKKGTGVFYSGVKPHSVNSSDIDKETGLTYQIIKKNDITILFIAVTELMNSYTNVDIVNYTPTSNKGKNTFIKQITKLRATYPCDVFIISIHTNEVEYEVNIKDERRNYYYQLLDSGADIIWANHPHVMKDWEVISFSSIPGSTDSIGTSLLTQKLSSDSTKKNDTTSNTTTVQKEVATKSPSTSSVSLTGNKVIFYSLGNCISGQRRSPDYKNPANSRDYTGDSCLMQLQLIKKDSSIEMTVTPVLITNYIAPNNDFVIRRFDQNFIHSFTNNNSQLETYYSSRYSLMQNTQGHLICR